MDGGADEGPAHLEVQFWWTLRHLDRPTYVTMVTARNSGSSYLNRVELQNGCLTLAHSNLFIPSNLNGSCFNPETGKLDKSRLKANMDTATEIYINRANNAPCGKTQIHLFRGADSHEQQVLRNDVLVYLKGSKRQKEKLKADKSEIYKLLSKVWEIRESHIDEGLPPQYMFFLKCCLAKDCSHYICQQFCTNEQPLRNTWFVGGPSLDYIPFPVPDPAFSWGSSTCSKCCVKDNCYGHFLAPEEGIKMNSKALKNPPSLILKAFFNELGGEQPSDSDVTDVAKMTLLSPEEVHLWLQHLQTVSTNRKRAAKNAAITRSRKNAIKKSQEYFCECGVKYEEKTDEIEKWIGCDKCDQWNHCSCVGVIENSSLPEFYLCSKCLANEI